MKRSIALPLLSNCLALALGLAVAASDSALAASATWNGSSSSLWSAANWAGGAGTGGKPASGDSLVFTSGTGVGGTTLTDDLMTPATFNIAGITFSAGAAAFTINPNSAGTNGFTLTGNITNSSTSLQTINDLITTTAVRTLTMTSGGGNIILGGNISGAGGGITTAGTGTLTLSGNNSFTGALTVAANTAVILSGSNGARPAGTNSLTAVTGTLQLQAGSGNIASGTSFALSTEQTANQPLALNNGSVLQLRSDSSVTFAGGNNFGGVGNSTITFDVNQLTASGSNNTLTIAPGGAGFAATTFNVTGGNGYTLALGTLSGVNFSTKALTLNPTTANLSVAGINNSGINGPITVQGSGTTTVTGVINGAGTLTKSSTGTLVLSGSNTYSGLTTINAGTMKFQAGAGNTLTGTSAAMSPSSQLTINSGATIALRADADTTFVTSTLNPSGGTSNSFTVDVGAVSTGTNNSLTLKSTNAVGVGGIAGVTMTLNVTGSNNDRLVLAGGNLAFQNIATQAFVLNPTTANITIASNFNSGGTTTTGTLTLGGTSTGNIISGAISNSAGGTFSVVKSNTGNWTLTGNNTYTGPTIISSGTLQIGDGTTDGSIASSGTISNAGALVFNVTGSKSYGNVITGSGTLSKTGAGTLALTGNNSYSGAVALNQGTLSLASTGTNTLSIGSTLTLGNNAGLTFDLAGNGTTGSTDQINVTGAVTPGTGNLINLSLIGGQILTNGSYTLMTAASGLGNNLFTLGSKPSGFNTFSLANSTATSLILDVTSNPFQTAQYWTGAASAANGDTAFQWGFGSNLATSASNWSTDQAGTQDALQVPGAVTHVYFTANNAAATSGSAINSKLDSAYSIKGITVATSSASLNSVGIDTNGNALTIGTDGLTLDATSTSAASISGSGSVILNGSQTWANNHNSNALTVTPGISAFSGNTTLSVSGTGTGGVVLSGTLSNGGGTLGVVFNQAGITQVNATNTFTGGVTLSSGTVQLGAVNALGTSNALTLGGAGDLRLNGFNASVAGISGTSAGVVIENGAATSGTATFTDTSSATESFDGLLQNGSGAGILALTKSGAGILSLTNANSYSGLTTLNGGTLKISAANNIGDGSASNAISIGAATLESTGNSYDLGVNRSVTLTGSATIQSDAGSLTVSGSVNNGANLLTLAGAGNIAISGNIGTGSGGLTKNSTGAAIFSGSNTFTGITTVNTGTVQYLAAASNTSGGVSAAMSAGSKLVLNTGVTVQLRADADTTFTTSTFNPNGGTTTTLDVGAINTGANNTLTLNSTNLVFVGGAPGATMTLNVTGNNGDRLKISGGNLNFADNTNTLVLNPTTANLTVATGLTNTLSKTGLVLNLDGTSSSNLFSGNITSGNTSLTKSNSSTWTLSGNNTYTGATTVNGGKLLVSGAISASTTTVNTGATLGGNNGSVGAVTVSSGGTLAPGLDSANTTAGSLTANGNVSFADGTAHLSIRLGETTASDGDKLVTASGAQYTVSLNGVDLQLSLGGNYSHVDGATYVILDNANASSSFTGTFAQQNSITVGGETFTILYNYDAEGDHANNDIALQAQAVPEPGSWAMMLGGLGMLGFLQKIRRRNVRVGQFK